MPEVYVHAIEGRSKDQKRALIKDITDAVVKNFGVTADAVLVEIVESSRDNKAKGGVLFSERSPSSNCVGVGGQPRITRSTGTTFDTAPMQAGLSANTPQPAAQSPIATTHFGSGVARQVRSSPSRMLRVTGPVT